MRILISGASRGLGFYLAQTLGTENDVLGFAMSDQPANIEAKLRFRYVGGVDVRVAGRFDKLERELVGADVLINNVGIAYDGILATQSLESIDEVVMVNLLSVLHLTKLFVRARLRQREPSVILSIGSIIGIRGYAGLAAYSATKAGIDGMTRSLARELGAKKFRVNSVLPGYMETDMSKGLSEKQKEQIVRRTPLGRLATCDDVLGVVRFLISDAARFVTGQSLVVDGGITI